MNGIDAFGLLGGTPSEATEGWKLADYRQRQEELKRILLQKRLEKSKCFFTEIDTRTGTNVTKIYSFQALDSPRSPLLHSHTVSSPTEHVSPLVAILSNSRNIETLIETNLDKQKTPEQVSHLADSPDNAPPLLNSQSSPGLNSSEIPVNSLQKRNSIRINEALMETNENPQTPNHVLQAMNSPPPNCNCSPALNSSEAPLLPLQNPYSNVSVTTPINVQQHSPSVQTLKLPTHFATTTKKRKPHTSRLISTIATRKPKRRIVHVNYVESSSSSSSPIFTPLTKRKKLRLLKKGDVPPKSVECAEWVRISIDGIWKLGIVESWNGFVCKVWLNESLVVVERENVYKLELRIGQKVMIGEEVKLIEKVELPWIYVETNHRINAKTIHLTDDLIYSNFTAGAMLSDYCFILTGLSKHIQSDLEKRIVKNGGIVLENDQLSRIPLHTLLLAEEPKRTKKYLFSLALNLQKVSYEWLQACLERKFWVEMNEYVLPNGKLVSGQAIYSKRTCKSLFSFPVVVDGSDKFVNDWREIIEIAGGRIVETEEMKRGVSESGIFVSERELTRLAKELVREKWEKVEFVCKEWVIRTLIEQREMAAMDDASFQKWD